MMIVAEATCCDCNERVVFHLVDDPFLQLICSGPIYQANKLYSLPHWCELP